jgi:SAM-dependent methyltransferase
LQLKIEAASVNRYKARGVTLATLLAEAGIDDLSSVSFIKIDCEGYDKEILRGSADFIRRVKPVLFVEWFAWFSPADDMDFFKAIEEIGYVAFDPQTLERVNVENRISDVVCIPGDNIRDWLAGRPVPASATPVSSSVSVASEEGSGTRNEKLTGLPPMSAAPRPQPFVIRWSNDMNRYRDLISLQGKHVLLIGFSEPQAVEFANREQIGSAIRLTLWADHVDTQGETFPIVIGDISRPTVFEDNQFDAVVTSAVLEHLVDMEGAFKEIKRITKHGGYFISEFGPVWSGAAGHHIYMDPGHPYLDFQQRQLPSHMHLLYSRDEIKAYYEEVGLGAQAGSVVHNIFDWDGVGRVMYEDYETLSNKYFLPLVKTFWLSQPHPDVLSELRRRHSPYTQFDVEGGFWILAVHKTGF